MGKVSFEGDASSEDSRRSMSVVRGALEASVAKFTHEGGHEGREVEGQMAKMDVLPGDFKME